MHLDDELCLCFHVSKRKILNYLRVHRPRVASQLSECGGAGTGCGWCVPFLKKLHRQAMASSPTVAAAPHDADDQTQEIDAVAYASARAAYIGAGKGTPPSRPCSTGEDRPRT